MPSLENIPTASPCFVDPGIVPVGDGGLLVGSGRQVLLLNAALRRDAENGRFKPPAGFLQGAVEEPVIFARRASRSANVQRAVRLFDRAVTIQSSSCNGIEKALLPWKFYIEESVCPEVRECDLTIESIGSGYIGSRKGGRSEVLADLRRLSLWLSREIGGQVHGCRKWFAMLQAGGVVYEGKLFAFPGVPDPQKKTLMASLCLAGHPYFGGSCLAILDSTLQTAALPLAIEVPESGWLQPPSHDIRNAPIEAIVFAHYDAGAQADDHPEWRRLPLMETIFEMLACESGPAENTPVAWRQMVAALQKTPAFEIHYRSIAEGHRLLERIAKECRN